MSGASSSSSSAPLERGKACLRCRRRKMKCDGARPICGQCVRADEVECEYTDGGLTASQLLEQNVAHLEARIRELEGRSSESITLHDPHAAFYEARNRPTPATVSGGEQLEASSGYVPPALLNSFIDHAYAFGFFLNMPRFLVGISLTANDENIIPPMLLYAVQLVGLVTVQDSQLKALEPQILSRLIQSLSSAVSDIRSGQLIYILQAEVLLSHYFFHQDRRLEGGYHVTAAVSIVISSNLQKLRGYRREDASAGGGPEDYQLPPPTDDVEQGERINAFWTVYSLDRCWSNALGAPSALVRGDFLCSQVSTPWPLDMVDYEQGLLPEVSDTLTLRSFISGANMDTSIDSLFTKRIKAATLLCRAVELASEFSPSDPNFQARFVAIDNKIEQFKQSVHTSSLRTIQSSLAPGEVQFSTRMLRPDTARSILFTHTVSHCATIKLHAPVQQDWDINTSRTLIAATQAADLLQYFDISALGYVDPFMGILWSIVAQVLIRALTILRTLREVSAAAASTSGTDLVPSITQTINEILDQEAIVTTALDRIFSVMETLTVTDSSAPLIAHELRKLRQNRVMFNSP